MRNKMVRWFTGFAVVTSLVTFAGLASAGFGSGGSSGGYASSYGSGGGGSTGYGSSGGYSAGYGSSGGYSSAGYGSSGGASYAGGSSGGYVRHVGPLRRLHNHIHDGIHNRVAARVAARSYGCSGGSSGGVYSSSYGSSGGISHGSSGGSYVGGGSSGGSYISGGGSSGGYSYAPSVSYGSSGGSSGNTYAPSYGTPIYGGGSSGGSTLNYGSYDYAPSYGGSVMEGTVIEGSVIEGSVIEGPISSGSVIEHGGMTPITSHKPGIAPSAGKLATLKSVDPREIHLVVNLPEEARMFVNGNPTTSTGTSRHFVSRNLSEGENYRFELKAIVADANGKDVEKTKTIVLTSGKGEEVNFDMNAIEDPSETILTLNVPENAAVVLANNATKTAGTSRVYRTKQLRTGETWDDYKIQVTVDGVTKEKVIRLIGGDNLELTFSFDNVSDDKLAMK